MNWKRGTLQIVLSVVIIVLGYMIYDSIMQPVRFNKAVSQREAKVIQRLSDIRSSEQFYKKLNDEYTGNFDTLINFLKVAQIPVVSIVHDPTDTTYTKTINDTIGYVGVADSLFGRRHNFVVDSLRYIPFSGGQLFQLDAGKIDRSGLKVSVFEADAHFNTFLNGLDKQLVINKIKSSADIEKFPGLKVGSMKEPSTDGNWE